MQITQSISGKIRNLSFVSAVLVVMIHAPYLPSVVRWAMSERICSVAVPCFFAISGFLLYVKTEESGWWRRETLKRVRTLLIPNLLVNLAYFPFVYLYRNGGVGEAHSNLTMQLRLVDIAGALGLDPTVPSACGPTWFLRNLFLLVLISPVLVFLLRRSVRSFIAVLLLAFAVYAGLLPIHRISSSSSWHYFISSGFSARGLLFFSLGLLAASLQFRPLPKWFSLGCLFLGGFLVLMGGAVAND